MRQLEHLGARAVAQVRTPKPVTIVIGLALLAGGLVLGGVASGLDPRSSGEYALDQWLSRHRTGFLTAVARLIEWVDGPSVVPWALLALGVGLFVARRRLLALVAVLMPALGWLPGHFAKSWFPRERPPDELAPVVVYRDTMSFPSGHTGFATSITIFVLFALTMWGLRRAWMVLLGVLWVLLVALSRLYASAHYLFDVVGGAALAAGTSLVLWPLAAWLWVRAQEHGGFWAEPGRSAGRSPAVDAQ